MRPLSPALEKRVRRADPAARIIPEAVVQVRGDVKQRRDHWEAADTNPGFTFRDDGSVRLAGSGSNLVANANALSGGVEDIARPPSAGTLLGVVEIDTGTVDQDAVIPELVAYLDPDVSGGGAQVSEWRMLVYGVRRYDEPTAGSPIVQDPVPLLSEPIRVTAGASEGDVTFPITDQNLRLGAARRKTFGGDDPEDDPWDAGDLVLLVAIWGVQSDGSAATNTEWRTTADVSVTGSGTRLRGYTVLGISEFGDEGDWELDLQTETPRLTVKIFSGYTAATLTFTTNPLDLGAAPDSANDIRFGILKQEFSGSVLVEVENDAATDWVEVTDGDTTDDLTGVGKRQTYNIRAKLSPNAAQDVTPILRMLAVSEEQRTNLDGLATVELAGAYMVDPITGKSETVEAHVSVIRDGLRDYHDAGSDLLAGNLLKHLQFDVYVGHPDLDREDWILLDTFFVDDHDDGDAEVKFICYNALKKLKQTLPRYDPNTDTLESYRQTNTSLKGFSDDLIENQALVPGRFIGPGIEDDTTTITDQVKDSTVKDELDAVEFLNGSARIGSQGRLKSVKLYGDGVAVAAFGTRDVTPLLVTAGARYRTPEFFVPWDFDFETEEFGDIARFFNQAGLDAFTLDTLEEPPVLEDIIARKIDTLALAQTVGTRVAETRGTGLILWRFRSQYAYPELEQGDVVAVATDQFVARDPNVARELRGHLWAVGRVTAVRDFWGTEIDVWIQGYADIIASSADGARRGFGPFEVTFDHWEYRAGLADGETGGPLALFAGHLQIVASDHWESMHVDSPFLGSFGTESEYDFNLPAASSFMHTLRESSADDLDPSSEILTPAGGEGTILVTPYTAPDGEQGTGTAGPTIEVPVPASDLEWDAVGVSGHVLVQQASGKPAFQQAPEGGINPSGVDGQVLFTRAGATIWDDIAADDVGPGTLDTNQDAGSRLVLPVGVDKWAT